MTLTRASLLFLLLLAPLTRADSGLVDWLVRMAENHRQLNYSGIFSFSTGGRLATYELHHWVRDGQEFEQLRNLGGGKDLLRIGHPVNCVHPGHELLRSAGSPDQWNRGIGAHYRLVDGGEVMVAGRSARRLRLVPRDHWRYAYEFDADRQSGLMLASRLMDSEGDVLESLQYASLVFDKTPPPLAHNDKGLPLHPTRPFSLKAAAGKQQQQPWGPKWVPPGFSLAEAGDAGEAAQSYTDGLSVFSVFLDAPQQRVPKQSLMQRGATVVFSRPLGERSVTVVGELPPVAARRIADSVVLKDD